MISSKITSFNQRLNRTIFLSKTIKIVFSNSQFRYLDPVVKLSPASSEDSVLGFPDELELQLLPQEGKDHLVDRHLHALVTKLVPRLNTS